MKSDPSGGTKNAFLMKSDPSGRTKNAFLMLSDNFSKNNLVSIAQLKTLYMGTKTLQ